MAQANGLGLNTGYFNFIAWQVCESLAVSAGSQEKGAIGAMFEREMKQEKNLEVTACECPLLSSWKAEMSACFRLITLFWVFCPNIN